MDYGAIGDGASKRQGSLASMFSPKAMGGNNYNEYMKGQGANGFGGYSESLARASEALGMSAEMITKLASGRKDIMPTQPTSAPAMEAAAENPTPAAQQIPASSATIQGANFPTLSPAQEMAMEAQRRRMAGM